MDRVLIQEPPPNEIPRTQSPYISGAPFKRSWSSLFEGARKLWVRSEDLRELWLSWRGEHKVRHNEVVTGHSDLWNRGSVLGESSWKTWVTHESTYLNIWTVLSHDSTCRYQVTAKHKGADKSLGRTGRKQANVSVRMAWISFGALPCRKRKTWWQPASRCCWNRARPWHASELVSFLVGLRTCELPDTYIHMYIYRGS